MRNNRENTQQVQETITIPRLRCFGDTVTAL